MSTNNKENLCLKYAYSLIDLFGENKYISLQKFVLTDSNVFNVFFWCLKIPNSSCAINLHK